MKRQSSPRNLAEQMERIHSDASGIASEAHALTVLTGPEITPASGGKLRRNLKRLQSRVDNLRRALWSAQSGAEPPVVPFRTANPAADDPPSLVDRVLSIVDRRRG